MNETDSLRRDHPLRSRLRALYFGHSDDALRFQGVLFAVDVLVVGFFIISQFIAEQTWFWILDLVIAAFVAIDLGMRLFAFGSLQRWLKFPATWIDLVVLATLLAPALLHNWGFLRILRLWTAVHSERFWNVLARGRWDDTHVEDLAKSIATLFVFVFLAAGLTQALFLRQHPELNNFIDAVYFVVASLTTTGYGDIALDSAWGRVFSIVLMLTGISLFLNIAHRVTASPVQHIRCGCGLNRHDLDARHCKSCGAPIAPSPRKEGAGRQT
jgi:voltage-gated potassium channel